MKKFISVFANVVAQKSNSTKKIWHCLLKSNSIFAAQQYKVLGKNVPADVMPKTFNTKTNKVETSNTKWWCSGFFPVSLLYIL